MGEEYVLLWAQDSKGKSRSVWSSLLKGENGVVFLAVIAYAVAGVLSIGIAEHGLESDSFASIAIGSILLAIAGVRYFMLIGSHAVDKNPLRRVRACETRCKDNMGAFLRRAGYSEQAIPGIRDRVYEYWLIRSREGQNIKNRSASFFTACVFTPCFSFLLQYFAGAGYSDAGLERVDLAIPSSVMMLAVTLSLLFPAVWGIFDSFKATSLINIDLMLKELDAYEMRCYRVAKEEPGDDCEHEEKGAYGDSGSAGKFGWLANIASKLHSKASKPRSLLSRKS